MLSESALGSDTTGGYAVLLVLFFIVPVAVFACLLTGVLYANWCFEHSRFATGYKWTFLIAAAVVAFAAMSWADMEAFWIVFFAEALLLVPILLPAHLQSRRAREVRWDGKPQVVDHSKVITLASALCWAWGGILLAFAVYGFGQDPHPSAYLDTGRSFLRPLVGASSIAFGLGGFALHGGWWGARWWVFALCTGSLVYPMMSIGPHMALGPAIVLELLIIAWRSLSECEG
jgi:hypothetical protein